MRQMKENTQNKAQEKHKCFLYYFKIFYQKFRNREEEQIIYIRDNSQQKEIDSISKDIDLDISKQFSAVEGLIIDVKSDNVIVDFADKNVAGLVLDGYNCAQEEVVLLSYPEGAISSLFLKPIQDNEAILVLNTIRYNYYKGYEDTFEHDAEERKEMLMHHILIIDAQCYYNPGLQYKEEEKKREILKCYTGFKLALQNLKDRNITISTGKWGCGIFRGNPKLKFLIQLYGFSLAKEALQLKNQSTIKFSAFHDDVNYLTYMKQFQDQSNQMKKLSHLKQQIDLFADMKC